jgi:hypothetical protein
MALARCGDTRAFAEAVLDVIDLTDEIRAGDHGVCALVVHQCQSGPVCTRNRAGSEFRDVGQHVSQTGTPQAQPGQPGQAFSQVSIVFGGLLLGGGIFSRGDGGFGWLGHGLFPPPHNVLGGFAVKSITDGPTGRVA